MYVIAIVSIIVIVSISIIIIIFVDITNSIDNLIRSIINLYNITKSTFPS
jgi:hypothetical protein